MRPRLAFPALFSLLLVALLTPRPTLAGGFSQTWSVAGWTFGQEIGNADGDPQSELLFVNNADRHLAIFDALTGALQQEFPAFTGDNTLFTAQDIDGDGRLELFFSRPSPPAATPLFVAYHWNGSAFVPLFSHTDPIDYFLFAHVRSATAFDILEQGGTDIRVRDLTGAVIYRASTAIAGWSGQAPLFVSPIDANHDGISELLINDHDRSRLVRYSGGFTQSWVATGWQFPSEAGNLDGDPQSEILVDNVADGRYAVLDGLTGAVDKEFPEFTIFNASPQVLDLDATGARYLFFSLQQSPISQLFKCYHWNGSSLATLFTSTDPFDSWEPQHFRDTTRVEILEKGEHDFRVRDLGGVTLFHAATDIPGWSGQAPCYSTTVDLNHDRVAEVLVNDFDRVRLVKYAGSFAQSWVANGWQIGEPIGNTDGDPQDEMLLWNVTDGRYALFDGLTGVLEKDLPNFAIAKAGYHATDIDGDGRLELFLYHYLNSGLPPLFTAYRWNGSSYSTMFSHTDSLAGADIRSLRSAGQFEVLEAGPSDVRVRDMSGAVIFRASTDIPGWAGLDPNSSDNIGSLDFDRDGIQELVITDLARVRFINHDGTTAVPGPGAVAAFRLFPSAPNPFRTSTMIRFSTPREGDVGIRIFDAAGRLVRRLDQRLAAGSHEIRWDGRDEAGRSAPSGVLFYEVTAGGSKQTRKVVRTQ